jgi:hypothetical protein
MTNYNRALPVEQGERSEPAELRTGLSIRLFRRKRKADDDQGGSGEHQPVRVLPCGALVMVVAYCSGRSQGGGPEPTSISISAS